LQVLEDYEQLDKNLWPCSCGCGKLIDKYIKHRRILRRFVNGHNQRGKKNLASWKGGRVLEGGYWYVLRKEHHKADKRGYVGEHIIIYEDTHNCCTLNWCVVHHRDHNPSNNVWYNLQGMTRSQHAILHMKGFKHTDETKVKMRGRKVSEEAKTKIRLANIGNTYWLGKHHSKESKMKISQALKGFSPWSKGKKVGGSAALKAWDTKRRKRQQLLIIN
jgi:NUMOD3 motif/HNH endonuclease